ncbi:hypothetical protein [Pararhodospirillum oryzae]|uniref:Uncharacterized protein n=1 Tax=Pararhodospirillum oryzae TaxID=478448 RepID=A0A512H545_9PROT|nr:hypothetical protein [Pararhodospirillum oryzae]GEO80586.1 hypothetical protein ROR02_07170 [Pararhodospirillum oryzae]
MDSLETLRARCEGRNINPETLLATDYLNHFNEIIMLLDMVPDMPEIIEDCRSWAPKSYVDHFRDSVFSDKDLAIEAFLQAPARFKDPFNETIAHMNHLALDSVAWIEEMLNEGTMERAGERARAASRSLQKLMDVASAIIHGSSATLDQAEIDAMIGR